MRNDQKGIEGLPLRLMLVALLISLTMPTMIAVMDSTVSGMAEDKAAELADDIATIAEGMAAGGPGNVRVVHIPKDLPSGIVLMVGGGDTLERSRITWAAGDEKGTRYLRGVSMISEDGIPMVLSAGESVRLECPAGSWGVVKVSRV